MSYPTNAATAAVRQKLSVELIDGTGASAPGNAELHYEPGDPYAVTVTFAVEQAGVSWTFGRDLLVHGTYRPTGEGDVRVWPCLDAEGQAVVIFELRSYDRIGLVQFRTVDLHPFIDRMVTAVPFGTESGMVDVDSSLAALLVPERGE